MPGRDSIKRQARTCIPVPERDACTQRSVVTSDDQAPPVLEISGIRKRLENARSGLKQTSGSLQDFRGTELESARNILQASVGNHRPHQTPFSLMWLKYLEIQLLRLARTF